MTILRLVPDPATPPVADAAPALDALDALDPVEAGLEAWAHIAAGYRAALNVPGLDDDDRAMFRRCLPRAEGLAGIPRVGAV